MMASVTFRLVLLVFLLLSKCNGGGVRPKNKSKTNVIAFSKLIGGTPSSRGRFPYMCSLRRRGDRGHVCGGTLIKRQWVLTAAHCVDPDVDHSTGLSVLIYCGIYERDEHNSSKVFAADVTFIHPEWKRDLLEGHDIALIKLDEPYHSPLPDLEARSNVHRSGTVFAALGWGQNSSGDFSGLLQIAAQINFVAKKICNQNKYWDGQIKDSMICAGIGAQDTARGDSGGPLPQLNIPDGDYTLGEPSYDLLVGVTSFGGGSERGFVPSVYTSVGYFRDWIDCIIEEKGNCLNDGQQTAEGPDITEESKSTSSNATQIEQDSRPSPTSEASYVALDTSAVLSEEAPESLLAEGSDGAEQKFSALLDNCLEITPQRTFEQTRALERFEKAIKKDDSETVEELLCKELSSNAEFSSRYRNNWTLLHEAARYDAVRSATVLVDYEADIDKPDRRHNRPLHTTARYNSVRVAKLLIDSGADVDSKNYDGNTPLHLAAEEDSLAVAKLLLRKGADIESRDDWNETALHRAADNNAVEVAKLLIDSGAKVNRKDTVEDTPLHDAAWHGSLEVAKVLVDNGAEVDSKNNDGQTPLHEAARRNEFDASKFLVKNGASRNSEDDYGDTPFDEICKDASPECSPNDRKRLQRLLRV